MFIESFLEKQFVFIKRDGKYVIRFVSIFYFDVYEQAEAFSSIFNLQKFLSSITALNYLRTVLTVIISQVAQVCLEKTKGTSVYITPWHLFVSSLAYLSPPWNRLNCKLYKQLESDDGYIFNKTPQKIIPQYIWKEYNSRVDISLHSVWISKWVFF